MLPATEIAAFIGVALAAAAYLPQILHLVREHCAAGISKSAFGAWLLASLLITSHAVAAREAVFISLGVVQVTATAIVLFYARRYASSFCRGHEPAPSHRVRSTQFSLAASGTRNSSVKRPGDPVSTPSALLTSA